MELHKLPASTTKNLNALGVGMVVAMVTHSRMETGRACSRWARRAVVV